MSLAGPGDDPAAVAKQWIEEQAEQSHANVHREGPIKVGDLDAYRVEGDSHSYGMKTGGASTFVAFDGLIYRIDTISRASDADKFEGRGRAVVRSFRPLTPEEEASFEIVKLHVVTALPGETIEALSLRTGNALSVPTTAIINHVFITDRLNKGQPIKVGIAEPYVGEKPEVGKNPDSEAETGADGETQEDVEGEAEADSSE